MEEHGSIKLNHITLINYLESMGSQNEYFFISQDSKETRNNEYASFILGSIRILAFLSK